MSLLFNILYNELDICGNIDIMVKERQMSKCVLKCQSATVLFQCAIAVIG